MKFKKLKLNSIKKKILLALLPLTIVLLLVLFLISFLSTKNLVDQEIANKLNYKLDNTISSIQDRLNKHSSIAVSVAKATETAGKQMSREQYAQILKSFVSSNTDTLGSGIWFEPYKYDSKTKYFGPYAYRDGDKITYTEDYATDEYDYPNQEWYKNGANVKENVAWSDAYYDEALKMTLLT
ncbi:MAG: methyl-accepting chemotaxis protein, partial [Oscillospiraceae bacterium]|nr:methyl-accepting chemotaxis protein [Oscillospiraceae bacterium]